MLKHFTLFFSAMAVICSATMAQSGNAKGPAKPGKEKPSPDAYRITVKVQGMGNQDVYLGKNYADKQYLVDTTHLDKSGTGVFTGSKKLFRGLYFVVSSKKEILFETVVTDDQEFYIEGDTTYDHHKLVAKNSIENEKFIEYQKTVGDASRMRYDCEQNLHKAEEAGDTAKVREYKQCMKNCDEQVGNYKKNYMATYPTHYLAHLFKAMTDVEIPKERPDPKDTLFEYRYYRAHYWDNIDFNDEGMIAAPTGLLKRMLDIYMDKLTFQDPDSLIKACDIAIEKASHSKEIERYFIVYLTNKYETSQIMCQDKVFVHLAQNYYCKGRAWWADTGLVRKICEESRKMIPTLCGMKAKDLNMEDTAGILHRLYELDARYTILFFYDPTCSHCKKVIPVVNDIYNKHKNHGVRVYAVSTENKYTEWRDMIRNRPELSGWTNVCKTSRYVPWPYNKIDYNIVANPTIFILDKNQKIIAKKIDENNMLDFLEHVMLDDGVITKDQMTPKSEKPDQSFDDKPEIGESH